MRVQTRDWRQGLSLSLACKVLADLLDDAERMDARLTEIGRGHDTGSHSALGNARTFCQLAQIEAQVE